MNQVKWLTASELPRYESDAGMRSWLTEPGLLTRRIRAACNGRFRMELIGEQREGDEHVREIALCCGDTPWVFAQTRAPQTAVASQAWLRQLGERALGEVLEARADVKRTELEFRLLSVGEPLAERALRRAQLAPQALWVRRSQFIIDDVALLVQEVFFPHIGT